MRPGASPNQNGIDGGWPLGIFNTHSPRLHTKNFPGRIAQLENITRHAFDGEVFVHRSDLHPGRLQHDFIVSRVGNGAAGSDGRQPRSAPRAQTVIDGVVMQISGTPSHPCGESIG